MDNLNYIINLSLKDNKISVAIKGLKANFASLDNSVNKVKEVEPLGSNRYHITIDKEDNMLMNLREGDIVRMQGREENTKVRIGNLRGIRVNGQPLDMHGIYINGGIYKAIRPGTIRVGVPETELYIEQALEVAGEYQRLDIAAGWNGEGDFELRYDGEVLVYGLTMMQDTLADDLIRLETQFNQTSEYIQLLATKEYVDEETGKVNERWEGEFKVTAEQIKAVDAYNRAGSALTDAADAWDKAVSAASDAYKLVRVAVHNLNIYNHEVQIGSNQRHAQRRGGRRESGHPENGKQRHGVVRRTLSRRG